MGSNYQLLIIYSKFIIILLLFSGILSQLEYQSKPQVIGRYDKTKLSYQIKMKSLLPNRNKYLYVQNSQKDIQNYPIK